MIAILTQITPPTYAASALSFSEYVEGKGSSDNNAMKIVICIGQTNEVSHCELQNYFNGSITPRRALTLSCTLANCCVQVVAEDTANPTLRDQPDLLNARPRYFPAI